MKGDCICNMLHEMSCRQIVTHLHSVFLHQIQFYTDSFCSGSHFSKACDSARHDPTVKLHVSDSYVAVLLEATSVAMLTWELLCWLSLVTPDNEHCAVRGLNEP